MTDGMVDTGGGCTDKEYAENIGFGIIGVFNEKRGIIVFLWQKAAEAVITRIGGICEKRFNGFGGNAGGKVHIGIRTGGIENSTFCISNKDKEFECFCEAVGVGKLISHAENSGVKGAVIFFQSVVNLFKDSFGEFIGKGDLIIFCVLESDVRGNCGYCQKRKEDKESESDQIS